ncbi:MAG: prolyl oligopeptidase family serine peptidase [Desulfobacterales bacterium]|nr:MAG: prolyl oligopeptidase family serine peptidase [Desulfobacterales bacterium]
MPEKSVAKENFILQSEGLRLRVFTATPQSGDAPFPSVQIHHAGGGYEPVYEHMAVALAERGFVGITMIHRGYPGSQGRMEYGKGEITDIGNLTEEMLTRSSIDPERMGIMGYSRGAHNAILAVERYDYFRAGALWSTPVEMVDHVQVNPWIAEMFGGFPEDVPEEYRIRSSIHFVEQINCPLLLIHGQIDDVVPVRHTLRLAEALKQNHKPFELKLFPHEGHIWSFAGFDHNWQLTVDFFERHLK